MRKILSGLCASTVALTFGLATLAPVTAAPVFMPRASESSVNFQNVQFSPDWRRGGNRAESGMNGVRTASNVAATAPITMAIAAITKPRRGYRQHNGVWFPTVAFIAGAIVGGGDR
jgi:hypothetical protein